jgi:hypothetical protein
VKRTILWFLAIPLVGCQLLISVDTPQCDTDRDCVSLFGSNYLCGSDGVCIAKNVYGKKTADAAVKTAKTKDDSRWECIGEDKESVGAEDGKTVKVSFSVLEFTTKTTPNGLVGKACLLDDLKCESPVVKEVVPDSDDMLTFVLPHGFDGYFELNASNIMPSVMYRNYPYTDDDSFAGATLISPTIAEMMVSSGKAESDDPNGIVILEVYDCQGDPADGIHFEKMDGHDDHAFYYNGALPDSNMESTTVNTELGFGRESRATGGFGQVEEGDGTFKATRADTGALFSEFNAYVRGGYITYITLYAGY